MVSTAGNPNTWMKAEEGAVMRQGNLGYPR